MLSVGFLWAAFDRKRQGWHDKIAGTYVIYDDETFTDVTAVNLEPADSKPGWVWIVLWIVLDLTMPLALAATIWGLGPYVSKLLGTLFAGGG